MPPRLALAGSLHRGRARTVTIAAQSLALILFAGVLVVAIMGMPTLRAPSAEIPPPPPIREVAGKASTDLEYPEFPPLETLIHSLESLPNAPKKNTDSAPPQDVPGTTTQTGPPSEIAFLGGVLAGDRSLAVLKVGEKKYWAPEGGKITLDDARSLRVVRVGITDAVIEVEGQERRLDRAERSGSAVARLAKTEDNVRRNLGGPMGNRLGMQGAGAIRMEDIADPIERRIRQLTEQAVEIQDTNPQRAQQIRSQIERLEQQSEMRRERTEQIGSPAGAASGTAAGAADARGSDDR